MSSLGTGLVVIQLSVSKLLEPFERELETGVRPHVLEAAQRDRVQEEKIDPDHLDLPWQQELEVLLAVGLGTTFDPEHMLLACS